MSLKQPVSFDDSARGVKLTIHAGDVPKASLAFRTPDQKTELTATVTLDADQAVALADLAAVIDAPGASHLEEQRLRFANLGRRAAMALPRAATTLQAIARWLLASREDTNYTYDLTPQNRLHLAHFVAVVTGRGVDEIKGYMAELENDAQLAAHIAAAFDSQSNKLRAVADRRGRYGRRLGWYALVRALKPGLVVETGIDKGLGCVVLCAALLRNTAEGRAGRYLGTDIRPEAGALLTGVYAEVGKVRYGDSIASLKTLTDPIDFFINDSDHSADYEGREYETIAGLLSPNAVLVGDNAHVTDRLAAFAEATGRRFAFFREQPEDHFYAGAGIGLAFR
jgi:hypothetical protein